MIATWLIPHGKKKKSPCGLPPRLFSFHPRLGLGEAGAAGSQTRALGRERESAGALGLQGRATPEGRTLLSPASSKAGSRPLGTHTPVITTTTAPDPTHVHTRPDSPWLLGREGTMHCGESLAPASAWCLAWGCRAGRPERQKVEVAVKE